MAKLNDEHLGGVAGGHISYLSPDEVGRLNEILGADGVVVCDDDGTANAGAIGDDEIVVARRLSPEALARLREQGDIGDVQIVNGIRCVVGRGALVLRNGVEDTGDIIDGRRVTDLRWRVRRW